MSWCPPLPLELGVYCMNDETEIPMMPLSHGLFPFLLILCFPLFRLHVFFPYFDLSFHAFSSSVFSSCFFGDFNITLLQFPLHHVCLFSRVTLMRRNTFIFLMYVSRVDLNSWFCLDVLWEWLAYSSLSNFWTSSPWKPGWVIKEFGFLVSFTVPHRIRRKITVSHLESGIRVRV